MFGRSEEEEKVADALNVINCQEKKGGKKKLHGKRKEERRNFPQTWFGRGG